MPRRSSNYEASTVMTGDSSLRNLVYEPSQQGSLDDGDSQTQHSDGESALSSVLSSVKRDLKKRAYQGGLSTQSCSTRQSKSTMMWQDSESERDELYSSSTDEEEQDAPKNQTTEYLKKRYQYDKDSEAGRHDTQSLESTEDPTSESENSLGNQSLGREKEYATRSDREAKAKGDTRSSSFESKKKKKSRCKDEPLKKLRFSASALAEVANSRINEDRHELRPHLHAERLQHVDYVDNVEIASTNLDLSTLHPLGKEECDGVFKKRVPFGVPFEVPMSQGSSSSDDMSSIQILSTKAGIPNMDAENEGTFDEYVIEQAENKTTLNDEHDVEQAENKTVLNFNGEHDIEQAETKTALVDIKTEELSPSKADSSSAPSVETRRWVGPIFAGRTDGELLFATIAGVSFATLIILLVILFAT